MRVVVDTNIIVSGLLGSSTCRKILLALEASLFELCLSETLFEEYCCVIRRKKFKSLISTDTIETITHLLLSHATFVKTKSKINICRDPKDNEILETAIISKANIIVTGDQDLLVLNPYKDIPIIKANTFLTYLDNNKRFK